MSSEFHTVRRMCLLWRVVPGASKPEALQHPDMPARQRVGVFRPAASGQRILLVSGFGDDVEQSSPNIGALMV